LTYARGILELLKDERILEMTALQVGERRFYNTGDSVFAVNSRDGIEFWFSGKIIGKGEKPKFHYLMESPEIYVVEFDDNVNNQGLRSSQREVPVSALVPEKDGKAILETNY
jgi:hypothetical protein